MGQKMRRFRSAVPIGTIWSLEMGRSPLYLAFLRNNFPACHLVIELAKTCAPQPRLGVGEIIKIADDDVTV
jgi:hypothetical protein